MALDYIQNGMGHGAVADRLCQENGDVGLMRPYIAQDGVPCVVVNTGTPESPEYEEVALEDLGLNVNSASLQYDDWKRLDNKLIKVARERLRVYADLRAANTYGGFNGMATMVLQHETVSDPGKAHVDFDGLSESSRDLPVFQPEGTPLPIIHSGFHIATRRRMISANRGNPIDLVALEASARRCAEEVELQTIGRNLGASLNPQDYQIYGRRPLRNYGYTNFPQRVTKVDFTRPTTGGWTPATLVSEISDLIESLQANGFYGGNGGYMLYHTTDWSRYMRLDYSDQKGDNKLIDRLRDMDEIRDVRRVDVWQDPFSFVLVQMTSDVCEAINGMEFTTVQWDTHGGFRKNFKVLGIQVARLHADQYGNCGIAHGTPL